MGLTAYIPNAGVDPKYLSFLQNCTSATPNGYIEICKSSSAINPVPANGVYSFTVTGSANPVTVPVGECSGPIPATAPAATITEAQAPGVAVDTITAIGYSAPPTSEEENLLESFNLQAGTATVLVTPATPGDTSLETIVTFTNYEAPSAQLKLCKIAGPGVQVGTPFNFTMPPSTATIPVEAGPLAEGGYCTIVAGTFPVGTSATITEAVPEGDSVPAITVNGVSTPSTGCTPSAGGFPCSVSAAIGPGINEVSFTNSCFSPGSEGVVPCPAPRPGSALSNLEIVNYSLVSQVRGTGTRSYMTYRADMLNKGTTILSPLMAKLESLDRSSVRVVGQGQLNFASAPAKSPVASSNTFTILTDPAVPLDASKLSWAFYSVRNVPPGN